MDEVDGPGLTKARRQVMKTPKERASEAVDRMVADGAIASEGWGHRIAFGRVQNIIQRTIEAAVSDAKCVRVARRSMPDCPKCGEPLQRVEQAYPKMLNDDQFASVRAGDWFCLACKGDRGKSGYRYFWERELRRSNRGP